MKCRSDVFITLASVERYCLPTQNLVSASFQTKIGKDDVVNAHVQSKVVQLFDVCLFVFSVLSRQGYLCKGSLENRLKF